MNKAETHARRDLDHLLAEAERQPFSGWDFSWLDGRMTQDPLPWSYADIVAERVAQSARMLDMGTGGGELLAALPRRCRFSVGTEAWPPNVSVAARALQPLGVFVVQVAPAPDNDAQTLDDQRGPLPFRDESFDLVINRHESFVASEVRRVLSRGGHFITQQVGAGLSSELHRLLRLPIAENKRGRDPWGLTLAHQQVEAAGLTIVRSGDADAVLSFYDVGALSWYLKAVPWEVPGFSTTRHRSQLARLHEQTRTEGPLRVTLPYLWLEAVNGA